MAQKRMLNKCISISERVNDLSYEAMLIYTWSLAHTDDVGLLPRSPRKLKATVAPMWDMALEQFGIHLESIVKAHLYLPVSLSGDEFFYVMGHAREQSLKRDRKPLSISGSISDWKQVDSIWIQLENQLSLAELKGTEIKELNLSDNLPPTVADDSLSQFDEIRNKHSFLKGKNE